MAKQGSTEKPSDLVKGSRTNTPELAERDLDKVSGGFVIEGIKGESQDDKHKGEIG